MGKRIISLGLTVLLILSLFIMIPQEAKAAVFQGTTGNIAWRADINGATGTLTISRNTGSGNVAIPNYSSSSRPPWYGHSAQVTSIVIEANVTDIGNWAFADFSRVVDVTVPANITRIGNDAFRGCINLINFWSGGGVAPFASLTTVGSNAFDGCNKLDTINIPAVTSIGTNAFLGCRSLNHITTSASGRFQIVNGVLMEMNTAVPPRPIRVIKAPVTLAGEYTISDTVTTIDAEAFAYCADLTGVVVPASVTTIRDRAFAYSPQLRTATFMGDAPTTFGTSVFLGAHDDFKIVFFPHGLRWTAPRWQGYRSEVNNSRLSLDKYVIVLQEGAQTDIRATVHPSTAIQAVTWSIDDPSIADVDGRSSIINNVIGVVTGKKAGTATITVRATDSDAVATCHVIVLAGGVSASGVLLSEARLQLDMGKPGTLLAIVYPDTALADDLIWSTSNAGVAFVMPASPSSLEREIVPVQPGTATITVRTSDGRSSASCVVTVNAIETFIPVTSIVMSTTTIASGANEISLNASVRPTNATKKTITWEYVSDTLSPPPSVTHIIINPNGVVNAPAGSTGTIVVRAVVRNGLADDVDWNFSSSLDYTQLFTINVVPFLPVTGISEVPTLAFAGVPLQLKATVHPAGASYRNIEWSMPDGAINTADAWLDVANGILTAQRTGLVSIRATIKNGLSSGDSYVQNFLVRVEPYITNTLTLNANPGGSMSPSGVRQQAGGETLTITATPVQGYVFAGWNSTNGGTFEDAGRATTQFTMPPNATTVTAYFAYIGLPGGTAGGGGSGGVILPTPVHYFTNTSIYTRNSGASFGHVTVRDFQLFSHVSLDGRTLTRNAHYTASATTGFTEIVLANGYLNSLNQGAHTLTVHFTDQISVSAVFTVLWQAQVSITYDDVFTSDWYYANVLYVSDRGWMTAAPSQPRLFRPSASVTQGDVIDALYRMAGTPTILNQHGQPLQGRDASLEWVRANGIIPSGGQYNLNSSITRQDMAILFGQLVTVMRLRYPIVRDAPVFADEWQMDAAARRHVTDMFRAGIVNGRTASTFVPNGNITRAEFAAILHRFANAVL